MQSIDSSENSTFWYTSKVKLAVMSIVTLGIYELFWMYTNWQFVKDYRQKKMLPFWRAVFSIIWIYPLFKEIQAIGRERGATTTFPAGLLALGYILIPILLEVTTNSVPHLHWVGMFSSLAFLFLFPVQGYINNLNSESETPINSKFSIVNWIAICIGGSIICFLTYADLVFK
jgi:hypothetical protein